MGGGGDGKEAEGLWEGCGRKEKEEATGAHCKGANFANKTLSLESFF